MAVKTLDEAGSPFYYSTRSEEQEVVLHHGMRISGGMDAQQLTDFCREHYILLIVDAFVCLLQATKATIAIANTANFIFFIILFFICLYVVLLSIILQR